MVKHLPTMGKHTHTHTHIHTCARARAEKQNRKWSLNFPSFVTKQSFQHWNWVVFNWAVGQRGPMEIPSNNSGCCQGNRLFSSSGIKAKIAEDNTYIAHWTLRGRAGVYIEISPLSSSVFGMGRYSAGCLKKNMNTNLATKVLIYNAVLPAKYARAIVVQSL